MFEFEFDVELLLKYTKPWFEFELFQLAPE